MMVSDSTELGIRPRVHDKSSEKARSGLKSHLGKLLKNLHVGILKHRGNYFLFKGGQVLRHLAIDLVVLFPKLLATITM